MNRCPQPQKHRYTSKRAARRALQLLYRNRANGGPGRLHVYPCGDHWHVGHVS